MSNSVLTSPANKSQAHESVLSMVKSNDYVQPSDTTNERYHQPTKISEKQGKPGTEMQDVDFYWFEVLNTNHLF